MNKFIKINTAILMVSMISGCIGSSLDSHESYDGDMDTMYNVDANSLSISVKHGVGNNQDKATWRWIVDVLPNDLLAKHVGEYHIFSDGKDNTLAYVKNLRNNDNKWIFAIDYNDFNIEKDSNLLDNTITIVHEFGHILSLNTKQVNRDYQVCNTYQTSEGCTKPESFLNKFQQAFWQEGKYINYQTSLKSSSSDTEKMIIKDFYHNNPNDFINEYAATNPVEDFAESFAFFVLSNKVENPLTIKDNKLNFFYHFPELVDIRNHIRSRTTARL